nr:putative ribonuclease H-like domain-containing protein [Tanacetum cinerariifolium]
MAKQAKLTKSKQKDDSHRALKDKGIVDSGCSRNMTGNKAHFANYQEFKGGFVAFGGSNGRVTGKGKIKAGKLDFEDVYYMEELKHYNLFFVSQMCDKKNKVLFTDTDCHVLSIDFKLTDENQFDRKFGSGFLVGYSLNSKAFRVYNLESNRVEKNLRVNFLENKPNVAGKGHAWMFDLDYLTNSMNNKPVSVENQANKFVILKEANNSAGTQANDDQGANSEEIDLHEEDFVLPIWSAYSTTVKSSGDKIEKNTDFKTCVVTDFNNLETTVNVSPTPTTRIHTIHPKTQILGDPMSAVQTRSKLNKNSEAHALINLPFEKKAIRTKWVYRNKKDERGVVVRSKARLVTQGHRQKEGIDYDEVFALVARIEAIRIFLAFASYMGFIVYQIDVKSAFLYGTIDEEIYVTQPPGFVDPKFPNKVYKVVKALYGLHQAPRACVKTASTPIETQKPLVKDEEADDVDVHLYRSMIGSLMYLTASRPDIMFAVCAYSRFHVTPKTSHLQAVKRIFRRLSISWQETYFIAMQKADYCGYFYYRGKICCCCTIMWDAYEKKLIQMLKIHTDDNVADLLTKAFDVSRFNFLIVDFLNAQVIQYALMVNPTIYVSCIKRFWATTSIKKVNDVVKLRALINRKRVVVTEDFIRQELHLDDADGVECLPNEEIFTELARMSYEKPPPKLTFYKAFFSAQWKFFIHTLVQCEEGQVDNDDCVCRGLILKAFMSTSKLNDLIIWHARLGHVHFKRMQDMSHDGLIPAFDMDTEKYIECIFVGYAEHSKAFRFYVIKPNDSVSINSIIKSKDAIFDENRFSLVPIPSQRSLLNGTEDIGCLVVPEEVVQQPEPELRKSKRNRTLKDFGPEFELYSIEEIRDEMDVKTSFLNVKLDEEVYMNQPQGFIMHGNENKVCELIKSLYGLKQAPKQWHQKFDEVVLSNGYLLKQADKCVYSKFDESGKRVIICLYVDDMLIFDTDQVLVDLTKEFLSLRYYPSVLEGYTDTSWISNSEDNSSTSSWVFLLGEGAGKEAEWLKTYSLRFHCGPNL